jgi:hypothetical protein
LTLCCLVSCGDDKAEEEEYEGDEAGECTDDADKYRDGLVDCDDDGCSGTAPCSESDADTDADTDTDTDTGSSVTDDDGDGVALELDCDDTDPTLGAISADRDCDWLINSAEVAWGSDPDNPDSDGDWVADGDDIDDGRTPTVAEPLRITLNEGDTKRYHLIGRPEFKGIDVAFLFDTTPDPDAMWAVSSEFDVLIAELAGRLPGSALQYGLASYDDYAFPPFGYASSGDHPFTLGQQVTSDTGAVKSALDALVSHYGGDGAMVRWRPCIRP